MSKLHYHESPTPAQTSGFKDYLAEDEELILVTGLSQAYIRQNFLIYFLFPGMVIGALVFGGGWFLKVDKIAALIAALIITGIVATLKAMHLYHSNRYLFTTRRVVVKKGLFAVKLTAALYDKITHIEVDQGFMDRMLLHHGTIIINTAGMNKQGIVLKYVDYPMELKNLMERLINREREQFGRSPGPVSAVEGEIVD
jgi:membrane protein YdbS with pleckstrin-like domain